MDDTRTAVAAAAANVETRHRDPARTCRHAARQWNGVVLAMTHGQAQVVLLFLAVLTLMAFWRLVLMICLAAALTVFALGLIEVITFVGALH
jgi:hypothetical protein